MSSISAQLQAIATSPQQKERPAQYKALLESILSSAEGVLTDPTVSALQEIISHAVDENVGVVVSRQLLQDFVNLFASWSKGKDGEVIKTMWEFALDRMQSRAVAFEEQVCH